MNYKTCVTYILFALVCNTICSQQMDVEEFLELIITNSQQKKVLTNKYEIKKLSLKGKNNIYLPTVSTNISIPSFSKSITPVQQDDGEYKYINVENIKESAGITVSQTLPYGGNLSLVSRLSHYSSLQDQYYTGSVKVNYTQKLSLINDAENTKSVGKIEEVLYKNDHIESVQKYKNETKDLFFNFIKVREQKQLFDEEIRSLAAIKKKIEIKSFFDPSLITDSLSIDVRLKKIRNELKYSKLSLFRPDTGMI